MKYNYSNELVCNILSFIDININRKITIEEIAFKFYYNRYYIMKLFKKELGISIFNYINYIRIKNSLYEINNYKYSMTRIAINNGFYSLEYFSEMFHKVMKVSPRVYLNYCKYRFKVSSDEAFIISNSLVKLHEIINMVQRYKKNKKPINTTPILKRSIFD